MNRKTPEYHARLRAAQRVGVTPPVGSLAMLRAWSEAWQAAEPGPRFLGVPESWVSDPRWRCPNGHVSARILIRCEGGDRCLVCREPVVLTRPGDVEVTDAD